MHAEQERAVQPHTDDSPAPEVPGEFAPPAVAITVLTATHRPDLQVAWRSMLADAAGVERAGEPVADAAVLVVALARHHPDVLLLDEALLDRLDAWSLRRLQCFPRLRVLLVADQAGHRAVADVLRNRFRGLLPVSSPPALCLKAIRAVSRGELWLSRASMAMAIAGMPVAHEPRDEEAAGALLDGDAADALTPRERQVVARLRRGCLNKEIARELGIREDTVKKHLQSVYAKLGVHRRAHVALRGWPGQDAMQSLR